MHASIPPDNLSLTINMGYAVFMVVFCLVFKIKCIYFFFSKVKLKTILLSLN